VALSPAALENSTKARAAWEDVLDRARRFPGVQSVALADVVPMRVGEDAVGYWATPVQTSAGPDSSRAHVHRDAGLSERYGHLAAPRRFLNEQDRTGNELPFVIDNNLAQHAFRGSDPVGKPSGFKECPPTLHES